MTGSCWCAVCLVVCGCDPNYSSPDASVPDEPAPRLAAPSQSSMVRRSVFDRNTKLGYEKLSQPEKVVLCLSEFQFAVNFGGFERYYFSNAADHARDVVQALETIGAKRTAQLVKATNDLFGAAGPSPDRNKRQEQLSNLSTSESRKMRAASEGFSDENIDALLADFVSRNKAAFASK